MSSTTSTPTFDCHVDDVVECPLYQVSLLTKQEFSAEEIKTIKSLKVPVPDQESDRIKVLREAKILDTTSEDVYDRYTQLASRMFKVCVQ